MVNWEISVGNLIEIGSVVVGVLWTIFTIRSKIENEVKNASAGVKRLEHRAGLIETAMKELERAMTQVAVQNERLNHQDERMNRLAQEIRDVRHGRGFVLDLPGTMRED